MSLSQPCSCLLNGHPQPLMLTIQTKQDPFSSAALFLSSQTLQILPGVDDPYLTAMVFASQNGSVDVTKKKEIMVERGKHGTYSLTCFSSSPTNPL